MNWLGKLFRGCANEENLEEVHDEPCEHAPGEEKKKDALQKERKEERPGLEDIVKMYGLTVPYTRTEEGLVCRETEDTIEDQDQEEEEMEKVEEVTKNSESARMGFYTSHLFRDRVEEEDPATRASSLQQIGNRVSESFDELVRTAETTRPVLMLRAAVSSVTFSRENSAMKDSLRPSSQTPVSPSTNEDLSFEHYAMLEDVFCLHDTEGRGFLTKGDLRSCLRTLGHNPTEQELWKFMARVDVDHSGTLDFGEFLDFMSGMMSGWDPVSDLGVCWRALDPKGKGQLNLGYLANLLQTQGAKLAQTEVDQMFGDINTEETHSIGFPELVVAVVGHRKYQGDNHGFTM